MIISYTILHYGKEWLKWSIRSVIDQVDEAHIFYTPYPSHGHETDAINPETKEQLYAEVSDYLNNGLFWHDCNDMFPNEIWQRKFAFDSCVQRGADTILVVDADEIWDPEVLRLALFDCQRIEANYFRINMAHFWRSLKWVCYDGAMPGRIIRPNMPQSENYLPGRVFHTGYAQTPEIIKYKMQIHGHSNEIIPGWYENKFLPWQPGMGDVHPVDHDYWNPIPYIDNGTLERLVGDHKFWNIEMII